MDTLLLLYGTGTGTENKIKSIKLRRNGWFARMLLRVLRNHAEEAKRRRNKWRRKDVSGKLCEQHTKVFLSQARKRSGENPTIFATLYPPCTQIRMSFYSWSVHKCELLLLDELQLNSDSLMFRTPGYLTTSRFSLYNIDGVQRWLIFSSTLLENILKHLSIC